MLSIWGFGNIKADLIVIAILSVNLAVILIYNYRQKKLEKKAEENKEN